MRRRKAWIVIGLLLLVGAGLASARDIDESTSDATPTDQSSVEEPPADVDEPSRDEYAGHNAGVDASPVQQLGDRLLRLLTINSLLTTHARILFR